MRPNSAQQLKNFVTEAVSLDREINEKTERFKQIKAGLVAEARSREDEPTPTDGGGTRWTAEGGDGCIARVNFPAPTLKAEIDGEGKAIEKIKQLAGGVFSRLFIPAISSKPVGGFREEVAALLPKAEATKTSCSSPRF